jgi:hypothetical protein
VLGAHLNERKRAEPMHVPLHQHSLSENRFWRSGSTTLAAKNKKKGYLQQETFLQESGNT